jgi:hypothetical protein
MKMPESLLSPSNILLYGRTLADLQIIHEGDDKADGKNEKQIHTPFVSDRGGQNNFLQQQLNDPTSKLARIYGFSFEGQYYDLAKPALFLVHGDGEVADQVVGAGGNARQARAPEEADRTGVAAQGYSFSEDVRVWSYDGGDYSIRLDVETGTFDQILLDAETRLNKLEGSYTGASARISGASARVMGASARLSGASARLKGNRGEWGD